MTLISADNDFAIMNRKQFAESRQQATEVFTYLLAGLREANTKILKTLSDFQVVSEQAKQIVATNRDNIDETLDNLLRLFGTLPEDELAIQIPQAALEDDYRKMLHDRYGIVFSGLLALANLPIQRFGSTLNLNLHLMCMDARMPQAQGGAGAAPMLFLDGVYIIGADGTVERFRWDGEAVRRLCVHEAGEPESGDLALVHPEREGQLGRQVGDALGVAPGVGVLLVDGVGQHADGAHEELLVLLGRTLDLLDRLLDLLAHDVEGGVAINDDLTFAFADDPGDGIDEQPHDKLMQEAREEDMAGRRFFLGKFAKDPP